nr:RCC1 domain-containing protein [Limisphaera ngatamarikiensis]
MSNVVAIAVGRYHGLALRSDGTVVGWGANYKGQASPPLNLSHVTAIGAGGDCSVALVTMYPRLAVPFLRSSGEMEFTLYGEDGVAYTIACSADLREWQPLTRVTCVNEVAHVRDGTAEGSPRRFYRAVSDEPLNSAVAGSRRQG